MVSMRLVRYATLLLLLAGAGSVRAQPLPSEGALRQALHAASVALHPRGCSGVIAEDRQLILTAYHCVRDDRSVEARLSNGEERTAWVVATNEASDQAVLFLEEPAPIAPLPVVHRRQIPGTILYFEGHPARPRFQEVRLDRVGRCSSLPALPNALFTDLDGTPGDSGAPVVDAAARVVGLVHGGAKCQIATPADALLPLIDEILGRETVELTRGASPSTPTATGCGLVPDSPCRRASPDTPR